MADTFTPHYNLTKPSIGGDPDTWGTLLNANFDTIDAAMFAALPKAGGTLTGNTILAPASGPARFDIQAAATNNRVVGFGSTTARRWDIQGANSEAESGSNAGSNFGILRYNDAGTGIDTPLVINRATGQTTLLFQLNGTAAVFSGALSAAGVTTTGGGNVISAGGVKATNNIFGGNAGLVFQPVFSNGTGQMTIGTTGIVGISNAVNVSFSGANPGTSATGAVNVGGSFGGGYHLQDGTSDILLYSSFGNLNIGFGTNGGATTSRSNLSTAGVWTAADFSATSDERLKDEIKPLRRGLEELKRMRPREYVKYLTTAKKDPGQRHIGFIAQEAQKVIPEAVTEDPHGILSLSTSQVLALLANAILDIDHRLTVEGL